MKRLLLIAIVFSLALGAMAQKTAREYPLKKLDVNTYIYNHSYTAKDSLGAVQDSILIPLYIDSALPTYYDFKVKVHELASPCTIPVQLQGKKFGSDSWSTITTITYKGVGTDTSMLFSQVSTKQFYQYYRLVFRRTANKARIDEITAIFKR